MPYYPAYLRSHRQSISSLKSRFNPKYWAKKSSSSGKSGFVNLDRIDDHVNVNALPDDRLHLTLGSAVRNGKFLQQSRSFDSQNWPLQTVVQNEESFRSG
jgi:hypothetical protein